MDLLYEGASLLGYITKNLNASLPTPSLLNLTLPSYARKKRRAAPLIINQGAFLSHPGHFSFLLPSYACPSQWRGCLPVCFGKTIVPLPPRPRVPGGPAAPTAHRLAGYIDMTNVPPFASAPRNVVANSVGGDQFWWSYSWNYERALTIQVRSGPSSLTVSFSIGSNPARWIAERMPASGGRNYCIYAYEHKANRNIHSSGYSKS